MKLAIAAAGTGGHIFPALAVALYAREREMEVFWVGTPSGMENQILKKQNIPLFHLHFSSLLGKGFLRWLMLPVSLWRAIGESLAILNKHKPDVLLVMGGYVSVPIAVAAAMKRIPVIVHEQNAVPGLANRLVSQFSVRICQAFPNSFESLPWFYRPSSQRVSTTGNPVRESFIQRAMQLEKQPLDSAVVQILILGGSLGALSINRYLPQAIACLQTRSSTKFQVVHQCGRRDYEMVQKAYASLDISATVVEFIDDIGQCYENADVIVARSGAMTISEIEVFGLPALLIPFPYATNQHQYYNAQYLVKRKQAIMLEDNQLGGDQLIQALLALLKLQKASPEGTRQRWEDVASVTATARIVGFCMSARQP